MADNFAIAGGTDGTVSTDQIGDIHYQEIKIVSGTKGESTPLVVDANGADVDVTRAAALRLV